MSSELEELRNAFENSERARKQAESELSETTDRVNELATQNATMNAHKRRLETDCQAMQVRADNTGFGLTLKPANSSQTELLVSKHETDSHIDAECQDDKSYVWCRIAYPPQWKPISLKRTRHRIPV